MVQTVPDPDSIGLLICLLEKATCSATYRAVRSISEEASTQTWTIINIQEGVKEEDEEVEWGFIEEVIALKGPDRPRP